MSDASMSPLRQALPDAAVVGGLQSWLGYWRYAVFSGPWLAGRASVFALLALPASLIAGFGIWIATADLAITGLVVAYLFGNIMLVSFAGPVLACWVRHRGWPEGLEGGAIVLSLLLGISAAHALGTWASPQVESLTLAALRESALIPESALQQARQIEVSALATLVNTLTLAAMYLAAGGGMAFYAYLGERQRLRDSQSRAQLAALRVKQQQSEMRLWMLQAQLQPHFLFNTLASISALLRQDPDRAEATLNALVEHLRATIPQVQGEGDAIESTLGQQIEICRSYLQLMRLRLADRLSFDIILPPADATWPCLPLLLITLVENAVKHGIEPKRGPGHIRICVEREPSGTALAITVEDDGVGLQPGLGSGLGLANVRAQLASRYGAAAALSLEQRPGGGVRVTVRLPLAASPA